MEKTNNFIVKHNDLVEARYRLTLQESHVVLWLLSKIQPDDEDFTPHTLTIKEFAEMTQVTHDHLYNDLAKITERLMMRVMKIPKEDSKTGFIQVAWLSSANYKINEGEVSLCFDPLLKPYLLQLKKYFTKISIADTLQFKSIHAVRIYELLSQYSPIGKREIPIEDLRAYCGIEEGEYKNYGDLKIKVINRAKKEINEKSKLLVECREIKKSRKVIATDWTIQQKTDQISAQTNVSQDIQYLTSTFNQITNSASKISASKAKECLKAIQSHQLEGTWQENWKLGLSNAINHNFYAGKIPMKKGDGKGTAFKLTIKYAAEHLSGLLQLGTCTDTSAPEPTNIDYYKDAIPQLVEFFKGNNLSIEISTYLLQANSFEYADNNVLKIGVHNNFLFNKLEDPNFDSCKELLKKHFHVDSIEIFINTPQ